MYTHEKYHLNETNSPWINYIYISNNELACFTLTHSFAALPPSSSLPIQVVNAISTFGNDKILYLQSKGCMPTANWPLQSFSYFYLVIVFTAGKYSWSHTYVLGNKYKRRQATQYVYEWKHLYHGWPFWQGSCRGGEIITVERKSEGDDETEI